MGADQSLKQPKSSNSTSINSTANLTISTLLLAFSDLIHLGRTVQQTPHILYPRPPTISVNMPFKHDNTCEAEVKRISHPLR